jgi:hypothetical protein
MGHHVSRNGAYVPYPLSFIFTTPGTVVPDLKDQTTGCYLDFHALRNCANSYLNAAAVQPSVVMLFMHGTST